jgi:hypothetical protein
MIGPQDTALADVSTEAEPDEAIDGMIPSYRMNSSRMMMIGIGTPRSQRRIPRPMKITPSNDADPMIRCRSTAKNRKSS